MSTVRVLADIAAALDARTDELVEEHLHHLRAIREYDPVSDADLRRALVRNVRRTVAAISEQPPPQVEEDERATGRRRALQGVTAETMLEAYRSQLSHLRDAFLAEAGTAGLDPPATQSALRALWDLTDRCSAVLVRAHSEAGLDASRRHERRRIVFLRRLLLGTLDQAELQDRGAVLGVLTGSEYWVFRGRQSEGPELRLLQHLGAAVTNSHARPLVGQVDQDIVGISPARPTPLSGAVTAVAGPVNVSSIPSAFAEATRVLRVALRYGRTGVVDSASLSVRMAVEQQPEVGHLLHRRYVLSPAAEGPTGADLLDTVRTWMHLHRSIPQTARALSMHENTVRYRLARFADLTGTDLTDTDALVEVWWAFEYQKMLSRSPDDIRS